MTRFSKLKRELVKKENKKATNIKTNIIHININSKTDIISSYSEDNKPTINNEFASFLDNAVKDIPVKSQLTLEISCNKDNQTNITKGIKNYYLNECIETERKLKHNLFFSLSTFIIGILALALTFWFNFPKVVNGAIDIFAWVFVWESFDVFFFRRKELKFAQYRQLKYINANIIFK